MNDVQLCGMSSAELANKVLNHERILILDVRNESDFNDWKIEGKQVQVINMPYFELLEGVDAVLDKIPDDQEVLVVCAKEGSSIFVAEQLLEQGKQNIAYLLGGMKSWSEHLEPVKVGDLKDGGEIYQFVRIGKGCLSYMVISNGEAAVIDAVRMTEVFASFAKENGHQYVGLKEENGVFRHFIRKAEPSETKAEKQYPHTVTNDEIQATVTSGDNVQILDVREPAEYAFGRIPGAISIPMGELEEKISQLDPSGEYYVVCRTGHRSDIACQRLTEKGFKSVRNVTPGMSQWAYEVEKEEDQ
ncbi:rhodanese-like domain-containing protein [Paenibacillus sp.]